VYKHEYNHVVIYRFKYESDAGKISTLKDQEFKRVELKICCKRIN